MRTYRDILADVRAGRRPQKPKVAATHTPDPVQRVVARHGFTLNDSHVAKGTTLTLHTRDATMLNGLGAVDLD